MGKTKQISIGIVVVFSTVAILSFIPQYQTSSEISELRSLPLEDVQSLAVNWDYKDILRNPQKYEGKIIKFTAEVWKVQQRFGDSYWLEVLTDCPYPDWRCGNFVVDYTGSRILKNDIVRVYAQVDYVDNYTILGTVLPVPYVTAVRLSCVSC